MEFFDPKWRLSYISIYSLYNIKHIGNRLCVYHVIVDSALPTLVTLSVTTAVYFTTTFRMTGYLSESLVDRDEWDNGDGGKKKKTRSHAAQNKIKILYTRPSVKTGRSKSSPVQKSTPIVLHTRQTLAARTRRNAQNNKLRTDNFIIIRVASARRTHSRFNIYIYTHYILLLLLLLRTWNVRVRSAVTRLIFCLSLVHTTRADARTVSATRAFFFFFSVRSYTYTTA